MYQFSGKLKFEDSQWAKLNKTDKTNPITVIRIFCIALVISSIFGSQALIITSIISCIFIPIFIFVPKNVEKKHKKLHEEYEIQQNGYVSTEHICLKPHKFVITIIDWRYIVKYDIENKIINLYHEKGQAFSLPVYFFSSEQEFNKAVEIIKQKNV